MKTKFYLLFIVALTAATFAQATTVDKAIKSGNWSAAGTWSLNRIPQNGDSVVIPSGDIVTLNTNETLNNVTVTVGGWLYVNANSALTLNNASVVSVLSTGSVLSFAFSPTSIISIGGVDKYIGSQDVAITGPTTADKNTGSTPNGFSSNPVSLPVTFVSFSAERTGNTTVALDWNTVNESDNSHFVVERSEDGASWTAIGTVAAGTSAQGDTYSFTDETANAAHILYRLQQVDIDGNSLYSKIVSVENNTTAAAKATVVAAGKTINVFFGQPTTSRVTVRLVSMGGQVLQQQTAEAATSTMSIGASNLPAGIYVVYLTDGQSWSTAEKVML